MSQRTIITTEQLAEIANKITSIERPMDFHGCQIEFTEEERNVLDIMKPIVQYLMYDEIYRLNHKLKHHHHVTLSVEQSMEFRDEMHRKRNEQQVGVQHSVHS